MNRDSSVAGVVGELENWVAIVEEVEAAGPWKRDKAVAYRQVLDDGTARRVADAFAAGEHHPAPPREASVNKAGGRRKLVYQLPSGDELLAKVLNRALQPLLADPAVTSPLCHSFLPGRGARSALRLLQRDADIDAKACLRLDIRDYFNSIDVGLLLADLPPAISGDRPLAVYLERLLLDPCVVRRDETVAVGPRAKGVMAGTPLAPILANLELKQLDDAMAAAGITYARYSDDICAFTEPADLPDLDAIIRAHLAARHLEPNEDKCGAHSPGEPWEFLGFRHHRGAIDVSHNTRRKLVAKATRLARRLDRHRRRHSVEPAETLRRYFRRLNRSLYGDRRREQQNADFCWATWFLPILTTPATLADLDAAIQRRGRLAATGSHRDSSRATVPYAALVEAGHLPLARAWWERRAAPGDYERVVAARTSRTD